MKLLIDYCCAFVVVFGISNLAVQAQVAAPTYRPNPNWQSSGTAAPVAVPGNPFGVLIAEVPLPPGLNPSAGSESKPRVLVNSEDGRILYPTVQVRTVEVVQEQQPQRGIGRRGGLIDRVRSAIRGEPSKRDVAVGVTIAALYRGDEPITLQLSGDITQTIRIQPRPDEQGLHAELLNQWWSAYVSSARDMTDGDEFPKLIQRYLLSMLGNRLGLPAADLDPAQGGDSGRLGVADSSSDNTAQPLETLSLLAAIEPMRERILEQVLSRPGSGVVEARQPVPPPPFWEPSDLPPAAADVVIEQVASRVPPECFYLRFGSFSNYVWFQEMSQRYGGDIAQAVLLRGFNYEATKRMERMLASKLTTLAKMFGDKLIGDMVLVGNDLYMKEGASLGVLFFATNPELLNSAMLSDRKAVLSKEPAASLQTVNIAGRDVSLLSTPDNRIRAFYVFDSPYVFVTTSESLVRRFLEVAAGAPSLAEVAEFRWARTWMPEANQYSVFGYFSPDFFHNLVSPQYQIELQRRLEAIAHLEVAEVASQAAASESIGALMSEDLSVEIMRREGMVPTWFDQRSDGSQIVRFGDAWIDSRRGARGSFMPIPDVPVVDVTPEEAETYARIAGFYQEKWRQMDPMLIGLRRFQADQPGRETVAFEGYVAPFSAEKYGWIASQLAEPTLLEMQLPVDDAGSVQLHVRGNVGLATGADNYHLFAGVKDMLPPAPEDTQGLIKTLQALKAAPAYIGAWPKPGIVEKLPLGLGLARPDYAGFSRMLGGLWRWQDGAFSLLSFDRSILDRAIPQIAAVESTDPAQARLQVADLTGSQLAVWVNRQWYARGWKASHGNTRLLDAIHEQLQVPQEQCMEVAQRLLDVKLQCPLGGQYVFRTQPNGRDGWWESTAWSAATYDEQGRPLPPPSYTAPWIEWFRGGKVHLTQRPDSLAVIGKIDLDMPPLSVELAPDEAEVLPKLDFDLFSLPMKLFGGGDKAAAESPKQTF